jgi:hypothetical protein
MDISYWVGLIGGITGIIGGLVGLISMFVTGFFWFRNRRPRLRLFVPINFCGTDVGNGLRVCFLLLWFTNHSKMPANLFLHTMDISIRRKNQKKFSKVSLIPPVRERPVTDFSRYQQAMFGADKVPFFNYSDGMPVTIENPLRGFIWFPFDDTDKDNFLLEIRIGIHDQFFKKHFLQVNLEEQQQKYDPTFHEPQKNK